MHFNEQHSDHLHYNDIDQPDTDSDSTDEEAVGPESLDDSQDGTFVSTVLQVPDKEELIGMILCEINERIHNSRNRVFQQLNFTWLRSKIEAFVDKKWETITTAYTNYYSRRRWDYHMPMQSILPPDVLDKCINYILGKAQNELPEFHNWDYSFLRSGLRSNPHIDYDDAYYLTHAPEHNYSPWSSHSPTYSYNNGGGGGAVGYHNYPTTTTMHSGSNYSNWQSSGWQNYSSSWQREEPSVVTDEFRGLHNQGTTCYLNSLLQTLYFTPEFRAAMYKWNSADADAKDSIPHHLQRLFVNMQLIKKYKALNTQGLTEAFGWQQGDYLIQHDLTELWALLDDALEFRLKGTPAEGIMSDFVGTTTEYVECTECGYKSARVQPFSTLQLAIAEDAVDSLDKAFEFFLKPEILDGMWTCEKCNKKVNAKKGSSLHTLPYIMMIQLNRFTFDMNSGMRVKLDKHVSFPTTLDMSKYVESSGALNNSHTDTVLETTTPTPSTSTEAAEPAPTTTTATDNTPSPSEIKPETSTTTSSTPEPAEGVQTDAEKPASSSSEETIDLNAAPSNEYELYSILIHSGGATGGHYTTYLKSFESGNWYEFDDETVRKIPVSKISATFGKLQSQYYYYRVATAYMLVYRKKETRNKNSVSDEEISDALKQAAKEDEQLMELQAQQKEQEALSMYSLTSEAALAAAAAEAADADPTVHRCNQMCKSHMWAVYQGIKRQYPICKDWTVNIWVDKLLEKLEIDKALFESGCVRFVDKVQPQKDLLTGKMDKTMKECFYWIDTWWVDIKKPEEEFEPIPFGGCFLCVFLFDEKTGELGSSRLFVCGTGLEGKKKFRETLSVGLNIPLERLQLVMITQNAKIIKADNEVPDWDTIYVADCETPHSYTTPLVKKINSMFVTAEATLTIKK